MTTTRDHLLVAVRDAAFAEALDDLTPASVARRAGAHRVTLYRFWPDIRSAIIDAFAAEIDRLVTVRDEDLAGLSTEEEFAEIYASTLERSLVEVRDQRAVYRKLFDWPSFHVHTHAILRDRAAVMIATLKASGRIIPGSESGTAAEFVAGASLSVYAAWAAADASDVEERGREIVEQMPSWWPRASATHLG